MSHLGKRHSAEWKKNQSEGLARAWQEGKFNNVRRPDYKAIGEKLRGRERSLKAREATAAGVKKAWRNGAYSNPETRAKHLENLKRLAKTNKGAPAARMDQIRALRDMDKLRPILSATMKANSKKWREDGTMQKIVDWNRKRLTGSHGLGRNQWGRLDHSQAKTWEVRSPAGEHFKFTNCREWVRQNLHRFHDYRPESRLPFYIRISAGFKNIWKPRKANAPTHYQGWTTVAVSERGDLLGRDEARMIA